MAEVAVVNNSKAQVKLPKLPLKCFEDLAANAQKQRCSALEKLTSGINGLVSVMGCLG